MLVEGLGWPPTPALAEEAGARTAAAANGAATAAGSTASPGSPEEELRLQLIALQVVRPDSPALGTCSVVFDSLLI